MRFRPWFAIHYPVQQQQQQQQQISGQQPTLAGSVYRPLPPRCQVLGRWSGGNIRCCRVLRNSMETQGFPRAGLNACGSTSKSRSPNPSGKSGRHPSLDPLRSTVGTRPRFSEAMRLREAVPTVKYEGVAAGVGQRWNRERSGSVALGGARPASGIGLHCSKPLSDPDRREQDGRGAEPKCPEGLGKRKSTAADWRMRGRGRARSRRGRGERR